MAILCIDATSHCQRCNGVLYLGRDHDWCCIACGRPKDTGGVFDLGAIDGPTTVEELMAVPWPRQTVAGTRL